MKKEKKEGYSIWASNSFSSGPNPDKLLKLELSLTQEDILNEGWQFMSLCGNITQFYKDFSGASWTQLDWTKDDKWITIARKTQRGDVTKIRYDGFCRTLDTLKTIRNLLNY